MTSTKKGFTLGLREAVARRAAPSVAKFYDKLVQENENKIAYMEESMSAIMLELENLQYRRMNSFQPEYQYSQRHIYEIVKLSFQMAHKNPITKRSIDVQADYVFGQGVSFIAKHPLIQSVIDDFCDYRENRKALTEHSAMLRAEKRQMVYGSMFFALYTNPKTGRVVVRNFNTLEVADIITDPEDRDREWFIKRTVTENGVSTNVYHPAYGITEYSGVKMPWNIPHQNHAQGEIIWTAPVLHVAYNRLSQEKFAIPELYPQLDWAIAYKRTLEQWISIIASFARMALKITGLSGRKQAAAAKALMATRMGIGNPLESNPSPVAGSIPLMGQNVDIQAIKTAGATTPASDADPIMNMAGCGVGLPNTFFGDAGKGNFATAKTLDRPTELKMISRQKLWQEVFRDILEYVILQSALAPEGLLRQNGASSNEEECPFSGEIVEVAVMPNNDDNAHGEVGQPIDTTFEMVFPEVLERNVTDRVRALCNALTMFGKPLTDIVPDKRLVVLWLMQALNIPNPQSYIPGFIKMWEANMNAEPGEPVDPITIPPPPAGPGSGAEDPSQGGDVGANG